MFKKIRRRYRTIKLINSAIQTLVNVPQINSLNDIFLRYQQINQNSSSLDLGCGPTPRNPFNAKKICGIDIRENLEMGVQCADLTLDPIPFEDNTFDYITAHDFLEHVPRIIYSPQRRFPFIELMNEIWRTLKPGGIFFSHTPVFPYSPVFRDPTHVNIITDETFTLYFDDKFTWAKMYGFKGSFEVLEQFIKEPHLISVLKKN